jgi:protein-disulfide isomerase
MKTLPWLRSMAPVVLLGLAGLLIPACSPKTKEAPPAATESAPPTAAAADSTTPVAKVGDQVITEGELQNEVAHDLRAIDAQIYNVKKQGLDRLIDNRLMEAEAKARGVSVDELKRKEIDEKTKPATDEDAQKFYDENKSRIPGEYTALKDRIKEFLDKRAQENAREAFVKGLREKAKVVVLLSPPRTKVDIGDAPVLGKAGAPVTMIEFSDYQCPFCRRAEQTVKLIREQYKDQLRLVFKDYPLPFHPRAMPSAIAARCAGEQGKYWEYHDKLFAGSSLEQADFERYAKDLGLDTKKFAECLKSPKVREAIEADAKQGASVGVSGTPAFFINGRVITGAQPPEAFREIIDEELAKAKAS